MASEKNAETLEEGFCVSKPSQNSIFCSEIREDRNPGCFSNVIENCVVDAYSDRNGISNADFARKFGNGSFEDFIAVDGIAGDNKVNEGSVNDFLAERFPVSMLNNDIPVLEGELKFGGNDEDQTAKVEEPVVKLDDILHGHEFVHKEKIEEPLEKGNDVLHPHKPCSPTKIEVSGNSINLFVEVFGPLDGISGRADTLDYPVECKLEERNFKQELSAKENVEDIIGEQECTFDIGGLVWVKTRNQLWWPGMISDPSGAPNDTTKCEKKGSYLVKLYGSANFIWCENADLKPFADYFEQMSGQNNSRNFYGSVDRALCEIGQRVNLTMTCSCSSKDMSVKNEEESFMSMKKASKRDVLSLSQFQPAAFIADIRDLARSMRVPGKVKLIVMKNRLAPFYRAIGHCELPLQQIRSGSGDAAPNNQEHLTSGVRDENNNDHRNPVEAHDGNFTKTRRQRKRKNHIDGSDSILDDKISSSAKGLESRERKKSKYLSYPYVDVKKEKESEDLKQSSNLEGSCSGMDLLTSGTKKPFKEHHIVSKADDISASSAELLAELCSSARDCLYFGRSKHSDSLKRFYCSFRMFAFLDADIASKVDGEQQPPTPEKCLQGSAEAEGQMQGSRVVKTPKKQKASAKKWLENNFAGDESSAVGNQKAKEKAIGKGAKNKEAKTPEVQLEGIQEVKESENQGVNLAFSISESDVKFPNTENPLAEENGVSLKTNKENEKVVPVGLEPVQSSFSMGANTLMTSSWMISFQQACTGMFGSSKTPQKSEGLPPGLSNTKPIPKLPDLNGNHPAFPMDHMPFGEPSINLVNPLPEVKKEWVASPIINGDHQMGFAFGSSSSKDVPVTVQNTPNTPLSNNGVTGPYQSTNADPKARALDPMTMNTGVGPFNAQRSFQMADFLSDCKPKPKRRKRKDEICQVATGIPDLNGNVIDMNLMSPPGIPIPEGIHVPPEDEQQKKRRGRSASGESGPSLGGNLLLKFAPGCVPPRETLLATFSRFGLLNESELEVATDDRVKIAYERISEARFACRSLEKGHPFGETLLGFNLDSSSMPEPPKMKKKNNLLLHSFVPCRNQSKPGETPDIAFIKQNVEMMKSTLEKAGNNLSPETRAKLEKEIKAFLDKIAP